ncbi:hypothetical protein DUNSADRAFT_13584 [Dunaliella salina]|uniref:Uncharacterized protein n=1 Tax=Dunaliella salina TaxID=3046 RepID=A0ABQ7H365_DUNSA|nr:hypothetical protein DUNSADRAFT_13584 [Dunaliella salina]|eukprot:KAF5841312.1 hypothetical protein DUNSADRAFT_13584 [Dunaliella salina]
MFSTASLAGRPLRCLKRAGFVAQELSVADRASLASNAFALFVRRQLRPYLRSSNSNEDEADDSPPLRVQPVPGGLVISNIKLDVGLFGNPRERPVLLDALTISRLEIKYPSFTKPLSLSVKRVCVRMHQNRSPKRKKHTKPWDQVDYNKLKSLEGVLWTGPQQGPSRLQRVKDYAIKTGEPGPGSADMPVRSMDGLLIAVRSTTVAPEKEHGQGVGERDGASNQAGSVQGGKRGGRSNRLSPVINYTLHRLNGLLNWQVLGVRVQSLPKDFHSSIKLSVKGVNILLLTKELPPPPPPPSDTPYMPSPLPHRKRSMHQQQAPLRATGSPTQAYMQSRRSKHYMQRAMQTRPLAAARPLPQQPQPQTPLQAVPVHQEGAEEGEGAGVSPLAQGWDASHCLVKQWGVEALPVATTPCTSMAFPSSMPRSLAPKLLVGLPNSQRPSHTGSPPQQRASHPGTPRGSMGGSGGTHLIAGLHLHVSVVLRALAPIITPDAALLGLRMADRHLTYSKYCAFWVRRPHVPVSRSPALWWQHAGEAIIADCRRRYPIRKFDHALQLRRQYIATYRALHSTQKHYNPKGNEPEGPLDVTVINNDLRRLELKLNLGQAMVYRTFVALQHSRYLAQHAEAYQQWEMVLDMLSMFVDALPLMDDEDNLSQPSAVSVSVECPKVGMTLVTLCDVETAPPTEKILATATKRPGAAAPTAAAGGAAAAGAAAGGASGVAQQGQPDGTQPSWPPKKLSYISLAVNGVSFVLPNVHQLKMQATSITISAHKKVAQLGSGHELDALCKEPDSSAVDMLCIPALPGHSQLCSAKFDFSEGPDMKVDSTTVQQQPPLIYLNPYAPISTYLSKYKIALASTELTVAQDNLAPCLDFINAFMSVLRASKSLGKHSEIAHTKD